MTSHILLPQFDDVPATFSRAHPRRAAARRARLHGRHRQRRPRHARRERRRPASRMPRSARSPPAATCSASARRTPTPSSARSRRRSPPRPVGRAPRPGAARRRAARVAALGAAGAAYGGRGVRPRTRPRAATSISSARSPPSTWRPAPRPVEGRTLVQLDTVANIAIGPAPWGARRGGSPGRRAARGRSAARRRSAARADRPRQPPPRLDPRRHRRGRARDPRTVVVDMGWPSRRPRATPTSRPSGRPATSGRRCCSGCEHAVRPRRLEEAALMRVGVDIGGTKTEAVAIDERRPGRSTRCGVPTGFGADAVIASTVDAVTGLADRLGTTPTDFGAIGVGVPGAVDPASGRVAHAVNLGLDGLALGEELAARLGVRVRLENDVNVAALGAFHLLGHGPERSMAYLNLGTGLAAGLVLGGRLWRGSRGTRGRDRAHPGRPGRRPVQLRAARLPRAARVRLGGRPAVADRASPSRSAPLRGRRRRRRPRDRSAPALHRQCCLRRSRTRPHCRRGRRRDRRRHHLARRPAAGRHPGGARALGGRLAVPGLARACRRRVGLAPAGPVASVGAALLAELACRRPNRTWSDGRGRDPRLARGGGRARRRDRRAPGGGRSRMPCWALRPDPPRLPLWHALAARALDLSRVRGFALDEYIGLPPGHPESYRAVITREVVEPLGLTPSLVHVPGDDGGPVEGAGERYERRSRPPAAWTCRCSASAAPATSASTSPARRSRRAPGSRR